MALQQIPYDSPITDRETGRITRLWTRWLSLLVARVDSSPEQANKTALSALTGAVGATAFAIGIVSGGLYRLSFYARITAVGAASSEIEVTFTWPEGGGSRSVTFAAIDGTVLNNISSATYFVRVDAGGPIQYSIAYTDSGGTLTYNIDLNVETVAIG